MKDFGNKMELNAQQIAEILGGRIEGNHQEVVYDFSKIEDGKPGTLTFLANLKYVSFVYKTKASIVLVNNTFLPQKKLPSTLTLIRVPNAYSSLATLLQLVEKNNLQKKRGKEKPIFISPNVCIPKEAYIGAFTYIGKNVRLGQNISIYPQVYIGDDVTIGENTTIYSGVKIYSNSHIGNNCVIHSGSVIGSDGFGFANCENHYQKIPQIGNVIIEDCVEIGANTTIDRSAIGSTIIRRGVKLDNLIQVAHHVEIGQDTVIAAQSGISGSVRIGKNCRIGGQVGFVGHIQIGDNVCIGAQSGIVRNVKDNQNVMGSPATEINRFLRIQALISHLLEIKEQIDRLQNDVKSLKEKSQIQKKSIF